MFNFFNKKSQTEKLVVYSPADGELVQITEVNDDVFSQKMLGDGFAIKSSTGKIYAPVEGTVTTIFPTKHAIGITTKDGLEILLHLGLDTVELKGVPITLKIQVGQSIRHGDLIAIMDVQAIKSKGYDDTIILIYTSMNAIDKISSFSDKNIDHRDIVQSIVLKHK